MKGGRGYGWRRCARWRLCSSRHSLILAWSPESRTSGHVAAAPARRAGCSAGTPGPPSSAAENDSSRALSACPSAPGSFRITASHSDHRGQLAAGHDVRADRDDVGREHLVHALVEPLVAAAQEGERLLRRRARRRAHRRTAARRPRTRSTRRRVADVAGVAAVARLERRLDDVHADHHAGAAAVGRVVHLAAGQRRRVAVADGVELEPIRDRVLDVALAAEEVEPVREEREDVDLHSPRNSRSTSITLFSTSTLRHRVGDQRDQLVTHLEHVAGKAFEHAGDRCRLLRFRSRSGLR